jgi:predicted glycosyltransferase
MHTIAAELAAHHETVLVDGGMPVPRPAAVAEPRRLPRSELVTGACELRPDVVLIEHYPFSKWELDAELDAVVDAARAANPRVRVVCSLRDIPPRARHRAHTPDYDEQVIERLARSFDAVLVHTDPEALRFADAFPAADRIPVPVRPTGIVVGPAMHPATTAPHAVASAQGPDALRFLSHAIDAVTTLCTTGAIPAVTLHVFAPLDVVDGRLDAVRETPDIVVHEFTPEYGAFLAESAFSLSRAGYNTVAESLRARVPAVVAPRWDTDDERARAAALDAFGADVVVIWGAEEPHFDARALREAIVTATTPGRATRTPDLAGAATTRAILESLVG